MTAEVAILNTKGIGLAADSAVTLGAGGGKVYNTADKLFALSKYHPVGIMIYNSARIMGIEWETIIKNYRDFLGKKSFDKLSDYAGDFINFLAKFPYFTHEKMIEYLESMCFDIFSHILTWFLDDLHIEFDGKENIELARIDAVFNTSLKNIKEKMKKAEDEKVIKVDSEFVDSNMETINKMLETVFEDYKLSKKQIAEVTGILKLVFQKCAGWIDNYTGIVITGYGEREIFPAICDFKVSGKLGDSLIYYEYDSDQVGTDHTASIRPFAQTEMVHQFARGISPDFKDAITEKVDIILNSLLPLIKDFDKERMDSLSQLLTDYMGAFSDIVYKDPVVDIVACMEKSELTSMAEAMVNLTALRRHVSTDEETVGGPVDVALITKGDGFIWINKKTNYDPHLNRNLRQKYFRGEINENL
jgi:hypothetical protein